MENSVDDLVGIFEFVAPGQIDAKMRPRAIGRAVADHVLRRTKEQVLTELPPKLFRDAEVELTPEQAAVLSLGRGRGRRSIAGNETCRDDSARVRIDPAAQADLQFRSDHAGQQQIGAAGSRPGRVRRQRSEGDRFQPVGRDAASSCAADWRRFSPAEYHGQIPHRRREAEIERFRDDPNCQLMLMSYGAGSVGLNLQFASYVFLV